MSVKGKKVGFVGGGNMGEALIRGLVESNLVPADSIFVADVRADRTHQLAEQYGVSQTSISAFKKRHNLEIEEVRNNMADEYAGLWVARKMERIAEYQQAAEKMAVGASPRNQEVLVSILKAVAEELGQLPTRTQVNVSIEQTVYQVVGVSIDDI